MANCARGLLVEIVTAAGAVALLAGGPSGAAAQARDRDLAACTKIAEPDRRLACYDAVMRAKARSGELPPAPAAEAPESGAPAGDAFGLPPAVPRPEPAPAAGAGARTADDFGLPPAPPPRDDAREYVLKDMHRAPTGEAILEMADGVVWRQTDERYLPPLKPGTRVRVKRGLMGSFILIADRWSVRARRIR
ncbi:MAG: hypothetical protein KatS3mg119_0541 [Rhodothalassiaceae bacterium]|nr:MAG: hypothetical protein KatS3mg119_0541 [Rhodothalassiaceae bacterium]